MVRKQIHTNIVEEGILVSHQLLPLLRTSIHQFLSLPFYKYYLTPHLSCLTAGSQPFALLLCQIFSLTSVPACSFIFHSA